MSGFDMKTASAAEVIAEAARRDDRRRRGLPLTDSRFALAEGHVELPKRPLAPVRPPDRVMMVATGEPIGTLQDGRVALDRSLMSARRRKVRLSWSSLVRDNAKYAPALRRGKAVMILTEEYRTAKARARAAITSQLAGLPPLEGPVTLRAHFFEPNCSRRRDLANYTKLVHDALTGLAYLDDSQIDDLRWIRAGVDIDAPRCELTIEALT